MSFFDNKEEVINIELTQFGKYLLSKGKFDPKYYAFYDDDVIYDLNYTNISESQNSTEGRILNDTPVIKPQVIFSSVENSVLQLTQNIIADDVISTQKQKILNDNSDVGDSVLLPIGKNSFNSEYAPAWNLQVVSGTIDSIKSFISSDSGVYNSNLLIPQINMETGSYNIYAYNITDNISPGQNVIFQNEYLTLAYSATNIPILCDIIEKNVEDNNENFEIEIFKETEKTLSNGEVKKIWQKLSFFKKPNLIDNDILLDEEIYKEVEQKSPDPSNVEYYFDVLLDNEIEFGDIKDKAKAPTIIYGSDENGNDTTENNQNDPNATTGEVC